MYVLEIMSWPVKLLLPYLHQDGLRLFCFHPSYAGVVRLLYRDLDLIDFSWLIMLAVKFEMILFLEESMDT